MDDDSRRLELSPSLRQLCNQDLDPFFWLPERRGRLSAWWGHVPFAHWLTQAIRPRIFVELGTHYGVSYAAFCHAILRCNLATRCFAVDSWKGDQHAQFYDESVFEDFRTYHDDHYRAFSTLLRFTFDEARERIADGSVDLLHIDGLHTYDAVRHDFESWLPKVSARGVLLFHDIDVHQADFGVWRLWDEVRRDYPHFAFHHCFGLGVLAVGGDIPDAVADLCAINDSHLGATLRNRIAFFGDRWVSDTTSAAALATTERARERAQAESARQEAQLNQARAELATRNAALAATERAREREQAESVRQESQLNQARAELATRNAALAATERARERVQAESVRQEAQLNQARAELATRNAALAAAERAQEESARQEAQLNQARAELATRNAALEQLQCRVGTLEQTIAALRHEHSQLAERAQAIEESTLWRATAPLRSAAARLPRPVRLTLRRTAKAVYWVVTPQHTAFRLRFLRERRRRSVIAPQPSPAILLAASPQSPPHDLIGRRHAELRADIGRRIAATDLRYPAAAGLAADRPLISIVLPVYRPPLPLIEKTIASVRGQNYRRWELCIVDDGSNQPELGERLQHYAAADSRIKLRITQTNAGISGASNLAISMASGSHVVFLDHDDLLTCDALECLARVIADEPEVDLVYSDECKIDEQDEPVDIFCKPDWSPALLFNCMYIGHLAAYRRSLVLQLGGLRSDYDLSQDYDLALRASEHAANIRHVDRVLYCWRITPGSHAGGDKPHARQSNIAALQDALDRRSYKATVIPRSTANYVRWNRRALGGRVSIIIPSDDSGHIRECVKSVIDNTTYTDYELLVVTRSAIARGLAELSDAADIRFVEYDKPFNFSDKCNAGAAAAAGEYVIFLNDDVRVITGDWIEALLECLQIDGVAAASPKMLYENGTIQYAGLITGVRGLIGTAFGNLPADTDVHVNFAQSLREVSATSGACHAMRRALFLEIGGFDEVHVPIYHSDIDLCFRLRAQGYRCLYTPHATLRHIGHQSLAEYDLNQNGSKRRPKDKADIYLLRRWPDRTAYDPYFPPAMKALLHLDSPEEYQIFPGAARHDDGGLDILIVSHDLTNTGAPRVGFNMAQELTRLGHFVVVTSPSDGPYRAALVSIGVTVIIDALLLNQHPRFPAFARNFDRVIANTIVTMPAVRQLADAVDVYWYIHESQIIGDYFALYPDYVDCLRVFETRAVVWAASKRTQRALARLREDVETLEYGVAPAEMTGDGFALDRPAVFAVMGGYESRKGQDIAVEGIGLLPDRIRRDCRFAFFGRNLDSEFGAQLRRIAEEIPEIYLGMELSHEDCLRFIRDADVVLCPSRDDPLPLVSLDALAAGKILMCTTETGTSEYLEHMQSFVRIAETTAEAVCAAIIECMDARSRWPEIARCGHQVCLEQFSPQSFVERLTTRLSINPALENAKDLANVGIG
jgi:GT2 family glycosyltransferase